MALDPVPDDALAARARDGDADALGELFARHAGAVFATAYRLTTSHADADDIVQDVFVGLPEALRAYEPRGYFGAWIRRVGVRVALMKLRSSRRRREDAIDAAERLPLEQPSPVDRIAAQDAVLALPPALRAVFLLREVEGYSHAEIAQLLGISVGASMTRLSRAWDAVTDRLRKTT